MMFNTHPLAMQLIPTIASLTPLARTPNFRIRYSVTGQVLALTHFLDNPYHPLRRKLWAKYTRQANEFVLVVTTAKNVTSSKACVRTTIARRIRDLAFTELRERGWKQNGEVRGLKDHNGVGILENGGKRYPLKGCLAFFPYEESITTPREQLRREVQMGVEMFLKKHDKARVQALEQQLRALEGGGGAGSGEFGWGGRGGNREKGAGAGGGSRGGFGHTGNSSREAERSAPRRGPPRLAGTSWPSNRAHAQREDSRRPTTSHQMQVRNIPLKPGLPTSPAFAPTTGGFRIKR